MKPYFAVGALFLVSISCLTQTNAGGNEQPCLNLTYPKGASGGPDYRFDKRFDLDKDGRSFSCGPQVRPSQVRRALERFRNGVLYHSAADINAVVRFPITVHVSQSLELNAKTEDLTIHNSEEWFALQKGRFSKLHLAMVACSYLGNVSAMGGRSPGVMIGDGMFWFQVASGDPKVRLTVVNLYPVNKDSFVDACAP
jgi:hypothetical protein